MHLGAKYSPCMRRDPNIYEQIYKERAIEAKETGCCIAADGCYQTSECPVNNFLNYRRIKHKCFLIFDYLV